VAHETLVDEQNDVALRRIVTGPLDTNCWVVHHPKRREALLVDPGDEADRLVREVSDLDVKAIVLTHAHWDHVLALPELADTLHAPVLAHPADSAVWPHELAHLRTSGHWDAGTATGQLLPTGALHPRPGQRLWDGMIDEPLADGQEISVGNLRVLVRHTPGHTPGGVTLELPGHLLTGDTLFPGGPGLTGWPLSDFDTIIRSVTSLLTRHPSETAIHPGHGRSTRVGDEAGNLAEWTARGW
jgi:glyoxylase-like metal-dependent hydrolase (beta-lactamase superfamily II)